MVATLTTLWFSDVPFRFRFVGRLRLVLPQEMHAAEAEVLFPPALLLVVVVVREETSAATCQKIISPPLSHFSPWTEQHKTIVALRAPPTKLTQIVFTFAETRPNNSGCRTGLTPASANEQVLDAAAKSTVQTCTTRRWSRCFGRRWSKSSRLCQVWL